MRSTILSFVIMFLISGSAIAQGGFTIGKLEKINDDEKANLRKGFQLPDTAIVKEVEVKSFTPKDDNLLKVNLASILDLRIRDAMSNWVNVWNGKEGIKYGKIEMVDDGLAADITFVRYLRPLPNTDPISAMTWTDPKGKVHRLVPVYSYLMVCKSDSLEILWRKVDLTYLEEYEASAKLLASELKKLMRTRAKARGK